MSFLSELVPPAGITRVLSLSNLAKTVGHGVVTSVIVLYFIGKVGIGVDRVGLALSAGAAIGMLGSVPLGHLADLYGPRNVTVGLLYLLGVFVGTYAFVHSFPWLVVVVSLALMAESAAHASRGALIAGLIPPEERVRTSSYMRSVANVGIAIGAAVGGVALYLDSTAVYLGVLIGGGVCFILSGSAYLTVPSVPVLATDRGGPRWVALRDRPFLVMALLNTVLIMHITILAVALPIWISTRTAAPSWIYSAVLILNTAVVVFLQVRVSRSSERPDGGARDAAGSRSFGAAGLSARPTGRLTPASPPRWRRRPPGCGHVRRAWRRSRRDGSSRSSRRCRAGGRCAGWTCRWRAAAAPPAHGR